MGPEKRGSDMDSVEVEKHLNVLAYLHIIYSLFGLVAAVVVLMFMSGLGLIPTLSNGSVAPLAVLMILATVIAFLMILRLLPGLIGGLGLLKRKQWSRILLIVVAILDLFAVPLGTALGIYTLWVLFNPATQLSNA
jgi:hypothetical protein